MIPRNFLQTQLLQKSVLEPSKTARSCSHSRREGITRRRMFGLCTVRYLPHKESFLFKNKVWWRNVLNCACLLFLTKWWKDPRFKCAFHRTPLFFCPRSFSSVPETRRQHFWLRTCHATALCTSFVPDVLFRALGDLPQRYRYKRRADIFGILTLHSRSPAITLSRYIDQKYYKHATVD
jgi:hypothetical protein